MPRGSHRGQPQGPGRGGYPGRGPDRAQAPAGYGENQDYRWDRGAAGRAPADRSAADRGGDWTARAAGTGRPERSRRRGGRDLGAAASQSPGQPAGRDGMSARDKLAARLGTGAAGPGRAGAGYGPPAPGSPAAGPGRGQARAEGYPQGGYP
ncbi:MAG: hypothetical protein ACHP9Z_33640, partial [Streptosporangiales bacterium]